MTTTTPSYPLTTTFRPPAGCASLYLTDCVDAKSCGARVLPDTICVRGPQGSAGTLGCYPDTTTTMNDWATPQRTYSPGRVCPAGMSTAASAISPDGVWCCPTGLSWAADPPWCSATLTKGTVISTAANCNTPDATIAFGAAAVGTQVVTTNTFSQLPAARGYTSLALSFAASDIVLTARAQGIFLAGQTIAEASSRIGTADTSLDSGSTTTTGTGDGDTPATTAVSSIGGDGAATSSYKTGGINDAPQGPDSVLKSTVIGAAVGGVLGAAVLAGLCVFFWWWRRRNTRRKGAGDDSQSASRHIDGHAHGGSGKAELDGVVRNELEGTLGESRGAGIYVKKPELEGTPGGDGDGGVYVRKKAELDARTREVAELEAIPWSASKELTLPPSSSSSSRPGSGPGQPRPESGLRLVGMG
ncbi:hypothetical protein F4677DRAFT_448115 [Hypoxylon crocopeplum]|nr:hypothetical protein F4677DRAFT_448115 [Hypoxylon crocopeplum]